MGESKNKDVADCYRTEREKMIASIRRMCGDDSEDIVQDAMYNILAGNGKIKNIRGYIYKCIFNAAYDYLRQKKKISCYSEFDSFLKSIDGDFYDGFTEEIELIRDAGARDAILLRSKGHTYESIAQILNVPLGTIKSRINRARIQLLENFEKN